MEPGKLKRVITIQRTPTVQNADGEDVDGEPIDVWSNVVAWFLSRTGREFVQARQVVTELAGIIEIRYRPGVTPQHFATYEGRRLNFIAVDDVGEQHMALHLHYKEVA